MSFRSGANSDLVLNNLTINGTLTLSQPLTYDDFTVENLEVTEDCYLNKLNVADTATIDELVVEGHSSVQDIGATVLSVSGNTTLNTLTTSGASNLHSLTVQAHSSVQDISATVLSVSGNTTLNTLTTSGASTLHLYFT